MIDRLKRDQAAELIAAFAIGAIDSDDLESEWPENRQDHALEAVGSMLWLHYDDHRPRRMVGKEAATSEEQQLFDRYQAYLNTDLAYDWPEKNFIRLAGLGILVPLSLGLLLPIDRMIKAKNAKIDAAMDAHGDLSVWPFTNRVQWEGEPLEPYVR